MFVEDLSITKEEKLPNLDSHLMVIQMPHTGANLMIEILQIVS